MSQSKLDRAIEFIKGLVPGETTNTYYKDEARDFLRDIGEDVPEVNTGPPSPLENAGYQNPSEPGDQPHQIPTAFSTTEEAGKDKADKKVKRTPTEGQSSKRAATKKKSANAHSNRAKKS